MTIHINNTEKTFHLTNDKISYLFRVMENGQLEHLYYGKKITYTNHVDRLVERSYRSVSVCEFDGDLRHSLESIKQEFPLSGSGDFRESAIDVSLPNGAHIIEPIYSSYEYLKGKPKIPNHPTTFAKEEEAETLIIHLQDALTGLHIRLFYTIFSDLPVITRSVHLYNAGNESIYVDKLLSASVDLPSADYEMIHLSGAWARERHLYRAPLHPGVQAVKSVRGASSHFHHPFIALAEKQTSEHTGDVYSMNLVYSGNFLAQVEVDNYSISRLMIGIHPDRFTWKLDRQGEFYSPEAVLVYSDEGLNGMSHAYHRLYQEHLIHPKWANRPRPVLINNWEGTYFNFNEEKIIQMAERANSLGVELFVLDDGWFGKRNNDTTSLGDWYVDKTKLPNGMKSLADKITSLGMDFGLWFEPEMTNGDSHIMKEHPEWVIGTPNRKRKHGRHQYVLDFANPEVVQHIFEMMDKILTESPISYIKWDMNRNISEAYSLFLDKNMQGEMMHRYILGVYSLYEKLLTAHPDLLIESCASGGGRYDPAMLYYAPQTWTSDNSDAVERLKIQYGTSLIYPLSTMGAHVSAIPNHQVGRMTPLDTRANVAFFGVFGYELDPNTFSKEESEIIKELIAYYKSHRELFLFGTFIRLLSPFTSNETAWMVVAKDQSEAIVGWYQVLSQPNEAYKRIRLKGLAADANYYIEELNTIYSGSELENIGILLTPPIKGNQEIDTFILPKRDFDSKLFTLRRV